MCKALQDRGTGTLGYLLAAIVFLHLNVAHASTFRLLYSFAGNTDGCDPVGGVIVDTAGNLYGVTAGGPPGQCGVKGSLGTVFGIRAGGSETPLYNFTGGSNGELPAAPLLMDRHHNLYGSTLGGGSNGCGLIFEVGSNHVERTVHTFAGPPHDGCTDEGAMIIGAHHTLYGTTVGGGKDRDGTIFELADTGSVKLLHSFKPGRGGDNPAAGVVMDANGNLYGTNYAGGGGFGGVFEFTARRTYHVLYTFKGSPNDGATPPAGLLMNSSGDLFGVAEYGGKSGCGGNLGCGIVFEIAPGGTETVLHFFSGKNGDGGNPEGWLIADGAGNLYGTTNYGGGKCLYDPAYGCGTVFKLAPDGTETILYSFSREDAADGALPAAGLVADAAGNLYGTTQFGGAYGYGAVFEITP